MTLSYGIQGIIQKNMGASAFGKAKNDCSWGLGEAVSPQGVHDDALLKARVGSPPKIFFFQIKHAKTIIVREYIG